MKEHTKTLYLCLNCSCANPLKTFISLKFFQKKKKFVLLVCKCTFKSCTVSLIDMFTKWLTKTVDIK